jgi:senataxin
MLDHSVEYAVRNEAKCSNGGRAWKKEKRKIYERQCGNAAIIHIGTLDSAGTGPVLADTQYAFVLIDEAGQATEPSVLPLAVRTKRLTLCGDQQQLPPCTESCLLGTSLLERLSACGGFETVMLSMQYRMLPEIIAWPNKYFYRNLLQSFQKPCKEDDLIIGFDWPQGLPIAFVQVDGAEKSQGRSCQAACI